MEALIIVVLVLLLTLFIALYVIKLRSTKLIASEGQAFHRIFELANDPILVIDLIDGKVLDSNQAASRLLGYTTSELLGKSLQDLHPSSRMDRSAEVIAEVWQKKGLVYQDIPLVTKSGKEIPVEISAKVIEFKTKPGVLLFARDIRIRLEAEKKIKNYTKDLEKTNFELRETQSKLIQSEKLASVGNLAAGVAHEMNTPVGVIASNANVSNRAVAMIEGELSKEPLSLDKFPRLQKAMNSLRGIASSTLEAAQRVTLIVNSLKSFSRLDESEFTEVDLHEGLDNALILLEGQIKNKIVVHKDYSELPLVHCHPGQINQVYMNVLQNAIQAIDAKGVISLKTKKVKDNVVIQMIDSGRGIPQETMSSIFDPGFTTKGSRIGAGFGLPISYRIMETHGGSLEITSIPNEGTTVTLVLPLKNP